MSLKDRIATKAVAALKREKLVLPTLGETTMVRGLMLGASERVRAAEASKTAILAIAFALEDPDAPGSLLYNANDLEDHARIEALPLEDALAIINLSNKLSGVTDAGNAPLPPTMNLPISLSPEASEDEPSLS